MLIFSSQLPVSWLAMALPPDPLTGKPHHSARKLFAEHHPASSGSFGSFDVILGWLNEFFWDCHWCTVATKQKSSTMTLTAYFIHDMSCGTWKKTYEHVNKVTKLIFTLLNEELFPLLRSLPINFSQPLIKNASLRSNVYRWHTSIKKLEGVLLSASSLRIIQPNEKTEVNAMIVNSSSTQGQLLGWKVCKSQLLNNALYKYPVKRILNRYLISSVNIGKLSEYCRGINVNWEIQHETEQNLISTTFCPTIYILHLKHRIH